MEKFSYDITIGLPQIRSINTVVNMGTEVLQFEEDRKQHCIPLFFEYDREGRSVGYSTDSEEFTSDSNADQMVFHDCSVVEGDATNGEEDEFLVIHIKHLKTEEPKNAEEDLFGERLSYLEERNRRLLNKLLLKHGVIARSLDNLRSAKVRVEHSFEPKDHKPIYQNPSRLPEAQCNR